MTAAPSRGSLERRLPFVMTAVLVVVLGISLLVTSGTLSRNAEGRARDRLGSAVRQIAASVESELAARGTRLRDAARSPAVHAALLRGDTAGVGVQLERLQSTPLDTLPAELWDRAGETIARVRPRARFGPTPLGPTELVALTLRDEHDRTARSPHTSFSPMFVVGSEVHFIGITPVLDDDKVIGYVVQERRVTGPTSATQRFRELTGEQVSMLMHNDSGDIWALAPGTAVAAPRERADQPEAITWERGDEQVLMAAEAPVRGAPWMVALDTPIASVRARSRGTMITLLGVSLVLVAVGAILSWLVGRRITRPLVALTRAAEAIARGDEPRRSGAASRARDEVDRLAASFDAMSGEITASRRELERRVTESRATAATLEQTNRRLAEAIERAEHAQGEAERANSAKSDFLAVMSHELRTPLNAIAGYTQLLELGVYGTLNDAQRDALARIGRSEEHLLALINDVLNFAKIDAGRVSYNVADIPLDEVLSGIEPLVAPQVREKKLRFAYLACDPQLLVHADGEKLRQIVLNLVTNAIKFTPPGGRVIVECEVDGDVVRVHVRDTGVGIPTERLVRIFEPFVQGERALNKPNEGVGLGLAIAHDLTTGMGGTLSVQSEEGKGSVFSVTLPRNRGSAAVSPKSAEEVRLERA